MLTLISTARAACGLPVMLAICSGGCGGSAHNPDLASVSGIVTYNEQPVEGATVAMQPRDKSKPAAYGRTNADGRFQLQTFDNNDGAHPGEYTVTILKMEIDVIEGDHEFDDVYNPGTPAPPKYLVPKKYSNTRTSDLSATVAMGEANALTFELKD